MRSLSSRGDRSLSASPSPSPRRRLLIDTDAARAAAENQRQDVVNAKPVAPSSASRGQLTERYGVGGEILCRSFIPFLQLTTYVAHRCRVDRAGKNLGFLEEVFKCLGFLVFKVI